MLNLHEKVTIIFFICVFITYVWAMLQNIDNVDEDDEGFYDRRDRK